MSKVGNSTVLSNFAAVHRLDILRDTTGTLYLPAEVYEEVLAGQLAGYAFYDDIAQYIAPLSPNGWLHLASLTDDELLLLAELPEQLHRAEAACLCMARQAEKWKIAVSGAIGVLVAAVQDSHVSLDEANNLLCLMSDKANYRAPLTDLGLLL